MNPSKQSAPNRPVPDPNNRPSIRESLRVLQTPLRFLKGVGPKRADELEKFGLQSVEDLLYHLPFRYEDRRQIKKISDATIGGDVEWLITDHWSARLGFDAFVGRRNRHDVGPFAGFIGTALSESVFGFAHEQAGGQQRDKDDEFWSRLRYRF